MCVCVCERERERERERVRVRVRTEKRTFIQKKDFFPRSGPGPNRAEIRTGVSRIGAKKSKSPDGDEAPEKSDMNDPYRDFLRQLINSSLIPVWLYSAVLLCSNSTVLKDSNFLEAKKSLTPCRSFMRPLSSLYSAVQHCFVQIISPMFAFYLCFWAVIFRVRPLHVEIDEARKSPT